MAYTNPVTGQRASTGTLNAWLRTEKEFLADYIAIEMHKQGLLSEEASNRLSSLAGPIAQIINDWTHEG